MCILEAVREYLVAISSLLLPCGAQGFYLGGADLAASGAIPPDRGKVIGGRMR